MKAPNIKSRQELERLLQSNGIQRGSENLHDYERAKQLITHGEMIDQAIYHDLITFICDYLGV